MKVSKHNYQQLATRLIELIENNNGSFTRRDLCDKLRIQPRILSRVVRVARIALSQTNRNIDFERYDTEYFYRIVDNPDDNKKWQKFSVKYIISRLETLVSVCESMVNATSEDSVTGRQARYVLRAIQRIIEDVNDIQ